MTKAKKQKQNIIKPSPDGREELIDRNLHSQVVCHVKVFGFRGVLPNIVEAYREEARRYNREAERLEKLFRGRR